MPTVFAQNEEAAGKKTAISNEILVTGNWWRVTGNWLRVTVTVYSHHVAQLKYKAKAKAKPQKFGFSHFPARINVDSRRGERVAGSGRREGVRQAEGKSVLIDIYQSASCKQTLSICVCSELRLHRKLPKIFRQKLFGMLGKSNAELSKICPKFAVVRSPLLFLSLHPSLSHSLFFVVQYCCNIALCTNEFCNNFHFIETGRACYWTINRHVSALREWVCVWVSVHVCICQCVCVRVVQCWQVLAGKLTFYRKTVRMASARKLHIPKALSTLTHTHTRNNGHTHSHSWHTERRQAQNC